MLCIVFKVPPNLIGSQYEKLIIQMSIRDSLES